mgnify:CR=1 FL=1
MGVLISILTARSLILFISTTFSIMFVMLLLNIVTVDEVIAMIGWAPDSQAAEAFRLMIERVREVSSNILDILSQLLTKLLGWSGVEVDLSKINLDVSQAGESASE